MATIKAHDFDQRVIENIKAYCKANDISLTKLAKASGMTGNQIYYLSSGKQTLTLDMYVRICKAVREPLDYFLKGV